MNYERFRFSTFCCRRCVISAAHAQIEFLTSFLKSAPLVYYIGVVLCELKEV